ncbi:MAG: alpha/beta hydrolase [Gammaproteobacteria bacterium]|nr:alpha/beta hydrolase [Gammaproteobacteria bacterium]
MAPPLILVPGLGFGGAGILRTGAEVEAPRLPGRRVPPPRWSGSLADKARALGALVANVDGGAPHLVAHSMGGNIVLEMLRLRPDLATGRIVLLGAPLHGSMTARRVVGLPLGRAVIGRCMAEVMQRTFPLPDGREIGGIAGTVAFGIGRLFGAGVPGDGAVAIDEALDDGMTDVRKIASSHTAMLFSRAVAACIHGFLESGRFGSCGPGISSG